MNPNDDEKVTGAESGLGHDPLEWLDDDEDATEIKAEANESEPQAEVADASVPEVEASMPETSEPEPEVPEPATTEMASGRTTENSSFTFENHKAVLKLPEKLVVQIIEPLHSEWKTLLYDLPQSLEVDASLVKDIDAAGMQLFYALIQQMVLNGADVAIFNVNTALERHFRLFGLEDFFASHIHAA